MMVCSGKPFSAIVVTAARTSKDACVVVFYPFDLLYDTEHFIGSCERLFGLIERMQLEGMVAKRKDSVYSRGRSRFWRRLRRAPVELQNRSEAWR